MSHDVMSIPAVRESTSISDYAEISEILRSREFLPCAFPVGFASMVSGALASLDGQEHFERRRLESRLFTREALAGYVRESLDPGLEDVMVRLKRDHDAGVRSWDLIPLAWEITHQLPAQLVGIDGIDTDDKRDRFIGQLRTMTKAVTVDFQRGDHAPMIEGGRAAEAAFVEEFFDASYARRKRLVDDVAAGRLSEDRLPLDLITVLLSHGDEAWDRDLVLHESIFFLTSSISTTALALPHFMTMLLGWIGDDQERRTLAHDMDFLQRAANEAMRFIVAAPARMRLAKSDVTLTSTGRSIRKDERLALWFLPANSEQTEFGPDAGEFNPLRVGSKRPPWGLAFGAGSHMCIGKPLITGVDASSDGEGHPIYGTMARIARLLISLGVRLDPDHPALPNTTTYYNEYATFPVLLAGL